MDHSVLSVLDLRDFRTTVGESFITNYVHRRTEAK